MLGLKNDCYILRVASIIEIVYTPKKPHTRDFKQGAIEIMNHLFWCLKLKQSQTLCLTFNRDDKITIDFDSIVDMFNLCNTEFQSIYGFESKSRFTSRNDPKFLASFSYFRAYSSFAI